MPKPKKSPPKEAPPPAERELIILTQSDVNVLPSAAGMRLTAATGTSLDRVERLLHKHESLLSKMFAQYPTSAPAPNANRGTFCRVHAEDERLNDLVAELSQLDGIEAAYVKPPASPAFWPKEAVPAVAEPPAATPNFTTHQGYLDAAPGGIDARHAWLRPGGRGADVRIVDVEGAWQFTHEDLLQNQGGLVGGTASDSQLWRDHGTAVVGTFGSDDNAFGTTGICPEANVSAVSIFGTNMGSAVAIRKAADRLRPGDLLLIELHRPGPRHNYAQRADQGGYIAVEWWPDDYDAIVYAVSRGVIVVEAAGNGAEDLDDVLYDTAPIGFPSTWTNPYRRTTQDSGALLVGAGAPPPGTHGNDHGPDRSRLDFSNYGALIDAQGWGREVTTTGYGDLQGGADEDRWYTDQFSGTSSASPIVVGALGCLQGALRAHGQPLLTPATARQLLRTTGSPQQASTLAPLTQRIGRRPDLLALMNQLLGVLPPVSEQRRHAGAEGGTVVINVRRPGVIINVE